MEDDVADKKAEAVKQVKIKDFKDKGMSERDATLAGLVSMKRKQEPPPAASSNGSESEDYPYGLRLRLEAEDLKKLGIKELPGIGDICTFTVKATPESIAKHCVEFQVTDMKWDGVEKGSPEADDVTEDPDEGMEEKEGDY